MTCSHLADFRRPCVKNEAWMREEGDALITFAQRLTRQRHLTLSGFRKEQAGAFAVLAPAEQHASLIALKKQNCRQQCGVDIVQATSDDPGG